MLISYLNQIWHLVVSKTPCFSKEDQVTNFANEVLVCVWEALFLTAPWVIEKANEDNIPFSPRVKYNEREFVHPLTIWVALKKENCSAVLRYVRSALKAVGKKEPVDVKFLLEVLEEVSYTSSTWNTWKKEVLPGWSISDLRKDFGKLEIEKEEVGSITKPLVIKEVTEEGLVTFDDLDDLDDLGEEEVEESFMAMMNGLRDGICPIVSMKPLPKGGVWEMAKAWMVWKK